MTDNQRDELAAYFLGKTEPFELSSTDHAIPGDFEDREGRAVTESELTRPSASSAKAAAATSKTVSAWKSFLFAGITISKTTVRVTYTVSSGKAKSITTYSCIVNQNSDPFAQVSTSKDGAWISGGKATAECLVSVKRGAPTPWGQVTWSTAENVQYVTGNGSGSVASHGWR